LARTASKQSAAAGGDAAASKERQGAGVGSLVAAAWALVWIPLGWGVWVTLSKAVLLFK
jgi:hypothetical protein